MSGEAHRQGLLDTSIVILRKLIDPAELPDEMAISAVTLAELSAGPHQVRSTDRQDGYEESAERARRLDVLQRAEHEFDAIPFDADAARTYGRVVAAVVTAGRTSRRGVADLMIASVAIVHDLPLFTTEPDDYAGLDGLLAVVPVNRPTQRVSRPAAEGHLIAVRDVAESNGVPFDRDSTHRTCRRGGTGEPVPPLRT